MSTIQLRHGICLRRVHVYTELFIFKVQTESNGINSVPVYSKLRTCFQYIHFAEEDVKVKFMNVPAMITSYGFQIFNVQRSESTKPF